VTIRIPVSTVLYRVLRIFQSQIWTWFHHTIVHRMIKNCLWPLFCRKVLINIVYVPIAFCLYKKTTEKWSQTG